ncbi:hypothetical protein [Dinghuibacter silviterrae]|nr:hypothetical protein [Dinghuibacter silviterrae]
MPPTIQDVKVYFNQKGMPEREAETFFLFYEKRLWTSKRGNFFKSWKSIARRWIDALLVEMPWRFQRQGR